MNLKKDKKNKITKERKKERKKENLEEGKKIAKEKKLIKL